jgi:rod shape-determining protein MreD
MTASPRIAIVKTVLIALVLTLVPLPSWLAIVRPDFVVLTVLYWSIEEPRSGGIGLGWICGLILDAFQGPLLGEHALAVALVAYLGVREHQRIRTKPLLQQSLVVFAVLTLYEFVLWAIDGWSGHPLTTALRWVPALTGALLWPLVAPLLGRSYRRRR